MIFHENRLLADDSHVISAHFCRKLGKMSQNLSSAAVVIGPLRVKGSVPQYLEDICHKISWQNTGLHINGSHLKIIFLS